MTENKVLEETICQFWGLIFPNFWEFFLRNKIFQALFDNILFIIYKIFRHFILLLANRNVTKSLKLWTEVWIFLHTSVTKKNKVSYKKYENFSQKKTSFISLTESESISGLYLLSWRSESCHSFAKKIFVRATFWKFDTVYGRVWNNAEASRNFYVFYT